MKANEIHLRDPYVLVRENKYYMYGTRGKEAWGKATGLDVYISEDLINWSEPIEVFHRPDNFWSDRDFWAPEVHEYKGNIYMFVSFKSENACRGTQILKANSPTGPFYVYSDGPVTPRDWECLDGTLYIDKKGDPYIVFCHEWVQIKDGEICALRLIDDLKASKGEPFTLFKASEPNWALCGSKTFVTDGPFMYRTQNGRLFMLWASFSKTGYVQAVAVSDNNEITGKWNHNHELLFKENGGHGMIFKDLNNKLWLTLHSPNETLKERPKFIEIEDKDNKLNICN